MKKRFIALAAVYMLIPVMLLAQPAEKKTIVGVWEVKTAPAEQVQSPQLSLASPSFGRMVKTGDREFRLTFYILMLKAGQVTGFQRIQRNSTLSESGDESIGHARMDFLDANWNVVFSTTSEGKGTRLETPGQD